MKRLVVVMFITAVFFVGQLAGAIWAESDVLRIEAFHVLTDVAGLGLAALAMRVAVRRPTARFTFGLRRVEPVAAIFNAVLVLLATALLVREVIVDFAKEEGGPLPDRMLVIAAIGLVVNGISAWLIHGAIGHGGAPHGHANAHASGSDSQRHVAHDHAHDHDHAHREGEHRVTALRAISGHAGNDAAARGNDTLRSNDALLGKDALLGNDAAARGHDEPCEDYDHRHIAHHGHGHVLNLRGAWLHLFGDALGSLAAIVAALAIRLGASPKIDPIASFVVAAVLVFGGLRLLRDAVLILLEASPHHLAVDRVRAAILETVGVAEVHDLHVWSLGAGHDAVTAHVRAKGADADLASRVEDALRGRFSVEYVTIQVEMGDVPCQAESLEP